MPVWAGTFRTRRFCSARVSPSIDDLKTGRKNANILDWNMMEKMDKGYIRRKLGWMVDSSTRDSERRSRMIPVVFMIILPTAWACVPTHSGSTPGISSELWLRLSEWRIRLFMRCTVARKMLRWVTFWQPELWLDWYIFGRRKNRLNVFGFIQPSSVMHKLSEIHVF